MAAVLEESERLSWWSRPREPQMSERPTRPRRPPNDEVRAKAEEDLTLNKCVLEKREGSGGPFSSVVLGAAGGSDSLWQLRVPDARYDRLQAQRVTSFQAAAGVSSALRVSSCCFHTAVC